MTLGKTDSALYNSLRLSTQLNTLAIFMIVCSDFGTMSSLVAAWCDGRGELIPHALDRVPVAEGDRALMNFPARERLRSASKLSASTFRYTGTQRRVALGGSESRPEQLPVLVLKSLKEDAETFLSERACFNDTQRKATRAAGQLAGLLLRAAAAKLLTLVLNVALVDLFEHCRRVARLPWGSRNACPRPAERIETMARVRKFESDCRDSIERGAGMLAKQEALLLAAFAWHLR